MDLEHPRLNLNQLIVFFFVASEESISRAAEKLYLTQPTVTSHIKSLEKATQMKLIEIKKHRVKLTADGEGLYVYCKEIYSQALAAKRYIDLQTQHVINIGVSPIFASEITRAISVMAKETSQKFKINLQYREATLDLVQNVLDTRIDMAIIPPIDFSTEKLDRIRISDKNKLVLFASSKHPLSQKEQVAWQSLCQYPLVIGQNTNLIRSMLTKMLLKEGGPDSLQFNMTSDNIAYNKILVQDEISVSISMLRDIENEIQSGTLKILRLQDELWLGMDAVVNRGMATSSTIRQIMTYLKRYFQDL